MCHNLKNNPNERESTVIYNYMLIYLTTENKGWKKYDSEPNCLQLNMY